MTIDIFETADGSHSLFHAGLNETYHSRHGALQESMHVYIKAGLDHVASRVPGEIHLFEMGFGTGLNALLTQAWADKYQRLVRYTSIEAYPLPAEVWRQMNYGVLLQQADAFEQLHSTAWNREARLSDHFVIQKHQTGLADFQTNNRFHLVYYDAFAPEKQPELWTVAIFEKLRALLRPGGVLVTYCAKGQVKRNFKAAGFSVESLQGPPGKREMIRCTA